MQEIQAALKAIPQLAHLAGKEIKAERLGGLTNLVYKLDLGDERLILRIPGEGTEAYIDRKVEMHNARVAADAGVSAEVLHADGDTGLLLMRCIDNIVTMTPENFANSPGSPTRAAKAMKQLHGSGKEFQFRFELFAMIDEYLGLLSDLGATLPDGYNDVVAAAEPLRAALAKNPAPLAPCHCDPLCENFLDDGERMWIVDWEYSGMNDPLWDLGDLSVEAGFTEAQDREMMAAYCDGDVSAADMGRMVIYKALCDLLWTLWGLIQHANDNPVEDFWAYAVGRFERCQALMNSPEFKEHVRAVEAG
ncbi:phosphotransferase [Rhodovibrionaceae bacterium A322]